MQRSERTVAMQHFINERIVPALIHAHLEYDHPFREVLDENAEIHGDVGHPYIRVRNSRGELVDLEQMIEELKTDPRFSSSIPNPPKIPRGDVEKLQASFDEIASGKVCVE